MSEYRHVLPFRRLPITFGSLLDFPRDPIAVLQQLHEEHGDIAALRDDDQQLVFVFSPEFNKTVLLDSQTFHSRFFSIRGPRNSAHRRVTSGLLSLNGETHREHRRLMMAPFQKKVLSSYMDTICRQTADMLTTWSVGDVIDMNAGMTQFMLRLTSAILFGVDDPKFACRIGEQIDRWVHQNHETGMGVFVSDAVFHGRYDRLLSMADSLEADVLRMIELRRASQRPPTDVLSLLLRAFDDGGGIDEQTLSGHIALLFGAAHLTTAHTLAWTLFLLAQHPQVMQDVQVELQQRIDGDAPTYAELAELHLLERVVHESMRLLPASAYAQRVNTKPVQLGPFELPVGTPVILSQFITHRRDDVYDDPRQFRPDRWKTISPSPYAFLPFGAGPRMCIGAALAMVEIKTSLAMILQRCHLTVEPGATINGQIIATMLGPTSTVPMRIGDEHDEYRANPIEGNIHDLVDLPSHTRLEPVLLRAA